VVGGWAFMYYFPIWDPASVFVRVSIITRLSLFLGHRGNESLGGVLHEAEDVETRN
jgi:hypothetical protein